uniref:unspecific monooxygenase n=1 Tax=Zygaena filipendulae TaxID=287375 RepID=A0A286MXN5_9NEOP|nr:cytochrome P450 CYP321C6 [Zygaena filipendulae]
MITVILISAIIIILSIIHLIGVHNENYWKKRGVIFYTKNKVLGPIWEFLTKKRPLFAIMTDIYKEYPDAPAVGVGMLLTPTLYVKDPQNVHNVFQADFQSFYHRGVEVTDEDHLAQNILLLNGIKWKLLRQSMTPLFTSAKLRNMYYILDKSAQDFIEFLKRNPEKLKGNAMQTISHFCCAAIGAAVFGVSNKSTFESPFLDMSQRAFTGNWKINVKFTIANICSKFITFFRIRFFAEFQDFFIDAIKQVLRKREKENVIKHDFADICISLQKKGKLVDSETGFELTPTDELMAAQAFFFFTAGVEPTAASIFSVLFELGKNEEILTKVQEEIDYTFEKHNGELNYDAVNEMEFLNKVYNEALRMYPPVGSLSRKCVQDTVLPVGNIRVEKGTKILVPVYEYHNDPKYFPNPEVFDPERFSSDEKPNDLHFMPFGKGNRLCIGMRYAVMQAKAALVYLLRNYTVKSLIKEGGLKFRKESVFVRLENVDLEFIPREIK